MPAMDGWDKKYEISLFQFYLGLQGEIQFQKTNKI